MAICSYSRSYGPVSVLVKLQDGSLVRSGESIPVQEEIPEEIVSDMLTEASPTTPSSPVTATVLTLQQVLPKVMARSWREMVQLKGLTLKNMPLPLLQERPLPKWIHETYLETLRLILRDINIHTGTIIIDYLWMSLSR